MHGLLNINKPAGVTSRHVVDVVTKAAGTKQVGHAGTLDPLATGVLVLCVGWTTRLVPLVQQQHKEYRAVFQLGCTSDTDDTTGQVIEHTVSTPPTRDEITALLPRFAGRITQVPPSFSAVLVGGRRAYKLARRGRAVAVPPREVEVYRIDFVSYEFPKLELTIECGSGTYIRAIGRDLGLALGCGAVMSELVRTRIGEYRIESASPLSDVMPDSIDQLLLPAVTATTHLPRRTCTAADLIELSFGRTVSCRETEPVIDESEVALVDSIGTLAALASFQPVEQRYQPRQVYLPRPNQPTS